MCPDTAVTAYRHFFAKPKVTVTDPVFNPKGPGIPMPYGLNYPIGESVRQDVLENGAAVILNRAMLTGKVRRLQEIAS